MCCNTSEKMMDTGNEAIGEEGDIVCGVLAVHVKKLEACSQLHGIE